MSVYLLTTHTIRCDGPDCDEVYADVVEVDEAAIEKAAQRDGWRKQADGSHLCLTCAGRSIPHKPE